MIFSTGDESIDGDHVFIVMNFFVLKDIYYFDCEVFLVKNEHKNERLKKMSSIFVKNCHIDEV
jgi:hypothetical protein